MDTSSKSPRQPRQPKVKPHATQVPINGVNGTNNRSNSSNRTNGTSHTTNTNGSTKSSAHGPTKGRAVSVNTNSHDHISDASNRRHSSGPIKTNYKNINADGIIQNTYLNTTTNPATQSVSAPKRHSMGSYPSYNPNPNLALAFDNIVSTRADQPPGATHTHPPLPIGPTAHTQPLTPSAPTSHTQPTPPHAPTHGPQSTPPTAATRSRILSPHSDGTVPTYPVPSLTAADHLIHPQGTLTTRPPPTDTRPTTLPNRPPRLPYSATTQLMRGPSTIASRLIPRTPRSFKPLSAPCNMPSPPPYSPNSPAITTTCAPTSPTSPSSSPEVIGEFTLDALLNLGPSPAETCKIIVDRSTREVCARRADLERGARNMCPGHLSRFQAEAAGVASHD
ncbi:hypothetical protein CspHIS471_0308090 [Cutaneotrichosporon sp. HIS471]|nr:hypothetical protein CspHIS471_0308090 [Cutaneotrichosporon sp. HIS471]